MKQQAIILIKIIWFEVLFLIFCCVSEFCKNTKCCRALAEHATKASVINAKTKVDLLRIVNNRQHIKAFYRPKSLVLG